MERTGTSRSCLRRLRSNSRWGRLAFRVGVERLPWHRRGGRFLTGSCLDAGAFGRPSGAGDTVHGFLAEHSVRMFSDEMFADRVCPQLLDDWE
jgi:hypothetical protein